MTSLSIAVMTEHSELVEPAKTLAASLNLPLVASPANFTYLLELTPTHLALSKQHSKFSPLIIDFQSKQLQYRASHANFRNEILVRALGLKKHTQPKILDATAGLGRDSFILAYLGFEVILLERSPIIYALLQDAIRRAQKNPTLKNVMQRLHLHQADAISWLKNCDEAPDIIYLDPMFPSRKKTAAAKKEMQLFHEIMGEDIDAETLLSSALACATKRVVVKRSRLAPPIKGPIPQFNFIGRSSRFDVYHS